ncbi:hypothetical protein DBV10_06745 [Acidovorax sp. FJL06]|nr:hypothetical protein DBV10_06745 [Acidovorax sp. FJL06]
MVRAVLLILAGLHGATLIFWGWGSWATVVFMGVLWWVMGWLLDAAPRILRVPGTMVPGGMDAQQERPRPAGLPRSTGRKKTK